MKKLLRKIGNFPRRAISRVVPLGMLARLKPCDLIALYYHIVSDENVAHHRYFQFKTARQFDEDLAWLGNEFGFATHEDVRQLCRGQRLSTPNLVVPTFDDGLAECADVIAPLLTKHAAGGIFFVATGYLNDASEFIETKVSLCLTALEAAEHDEIRVISEGLKIERLLSESYASKARKGKARLRRARVNAPRDAARRSLYVCLLGLDDSDGAMLDRLCDRLGVDVADYTRKRPVFVRDDQVRSLHRQGFTVGAHSVTHRKFSRLPENEQRREILESCDHVRQLTGEPVVPFAFPYNARGVRLELLDDVRTKNSLVGTLFDTGGFRSPQDWMPQRVWTDLPSDGVGASLSPYFARLWL